MARLFGIDLDHVKCIRKSFRRTTKLFWQKFSLFYEIKEVHNTLLLSAQVWIHGRHHVVKTSITHLSRLITFLFLPHYDVDL